MGPAPVGNVPAALVGTWKYTSIGGTSNELDFGSDGSAVYSTIQQSGGTCTLTSILSYAGPAVTDESAATIAIYGNDALLTQTACGSTTKTPQSARTVRFGYQLGSDDTGPRLLMKDLDCIAQNGEASYCYANYSKS